MELESKERAELAVGLGALLGIKVVAKSDYDKLNQENKKLLSQTKDIDNIKVKLINTTCKLISFAGYHRQWKPKTRNIEKRLKKLKQEKLFIDFTNFPTDIEENLKEAYNCYINGQSMACYIMTLRTIEIIVNIIYEQNNPVQINNGKPVFIPVSTKLNWVKTNKMVGGADFSIAKGIIEARNESVHDIFTPTEKQLLSAFETVINLVTKLDASGKN